MYNIANFDPLHNPVQLDLIPGQLSYSINTIEYLGSKKNLLHFILPALNNACKEGEVILDIFAGTCSVGFAAQKRNIIYANDSQAYSYHICNALLSPPINFETLDMGEMSNQINSNFGLLQNNWKDELSEEEEFFGRDIDNKLVDEYGDWCKNTEFWGKLENLVLSDQNELYSYRKDNKKFPYVLFSKYYMNAYFGVKQSLEIDSIRYSIDQQDNRLIKSILLTALMFSMSKVVSSTTHFAQFLNPKTINSVQNLVVKRKKSIWEHYLSFLQAYNRIATGIDQNKIVFPYQSKNRCFNQDYSLLMNNQESGNIKCVYADPPYFKEHYSRYYHILETLVNYDYPELSLNPQTKMTSEGRYRSDRFVSEFSKRSTAPQAFELLANLSHQNRSNLVISYSDNGIFDNEELEKLLKKIYRDVDIYAHNHQHSKQGRTSMTDVVELLYVCLL